MSFNFIRRRPKIPKNEIIRDYGVYTYEIREMEQENDSDEK